jgi:hypothetical protein
MASQRNAQCECYDTQCKGGQHSPTVYYGRCLTTARLVTLYRVDMDDRTGTRLCRPCADDAMASGLFRQGR